MKSTKTVLGIIAAIIVIIGVAVILAKYGNKSVDIAANPPAATTVPPVTTPPVTTPPATTPPTTGPQTYTMADVSSHNSAASCWSAIGGKVYDLTSWINAHPGGKRAILSLCGKDGTSAFNGQHGGQSKPEQELASLLVGDITN